jgi:hypothetical protein
VVPREGLQDGRLSAVEAAIAAGVVTTSGADFSFTAAAILKSCSPTRRRPLTRIFGALLLALAVRIAHRWPDNATTDWPGMARVGQEMPDRDAKLGTATGHRAWNLKAFWWHSGGAL